MCSSKKIQYLLSMFIFKHTLYYFYCKIIKKQEKKELIVLRNNRWLILQFMIGMICAYNLPKTIIERYFIEDLKLTKKNIFSYNSRRITTTPAKWWTPNTFVCDGIIIRAALHRHLRIFATMRILSMLHWPVMEGA